MKLSSHVRAYVRAYARVRELFSICFWFHNETWFWKMNPSGKNKDVRFIANGTSNTMKIEKLDYFFLNIFFQLIK